MNSVVNSGDFAPYQQYLTWPWCEKFGLVGRQFSGNFGPLDFVQKCGYIHHQQSSYVL